MLINIALDAMGGDNAPQAACEGAVEALKEFGDIAVTLFGKQEEIQKYIPENEPRLTVVDCPEEIPMDEEQPMLAARRMKQSSMVMAVNAVKEGRCAAFVSAGSTGAIMACGILYARRIKGIDRPAIATMLPGSTHPFLLIDSGANVDCSPANLNQFALMGCTYMEKVAGVEKAVAGLVNNGTEDCKGNQQTKEAHQLMKAQDQYEFYGNLEAREIPFSPCNVVACDGFVGNVILKYTEGLAKALTGMLKETIMESGTRAKLGGLLLKPALATFKKKMNADEYGGAPLLGVNAPMIKAHGSSNATAFKNALRQAKLMVETNVTDTIRTALEKLAEPEA